MRLHALPRVLLITDPRVSLAHTVNVVRAAGGALGVSGLAVQLRDKGYDVARVRSWAKALREATHAVGAVFLVNGRVDVAVDVHADGVHVPAAAPPSMLEQALVARTLLGDLALVTVAAHSDDEVRVASQLGADAVLVSPIFATPGKGSPRGVDALRTARTVVDRAQEASRLPWLYALGGVTPSVAAACYSAGADGVAVIRALLASDVDTVHAALALTPPSAQIGA